MHLNIPAKETQICWIWASHDLNIGIRTSRVQVSSPYIPRGCIFDVHRSFLQKYTGVSCRSLLMYILLGCPYIQGCMENLGCMDHTDSYTNEFSIHPQMYGHPKSIYIKRDLQETPVYLCKRDLYTSKKNVHFFVCRHTPLLDLGQSRFQHQDQEQ